MVDEGKDARPLLVSVQRNLETNIHTFHVDERGGPFTLQSQQCSREDVGDPLILVCVTKSWVHQGKNNALLISFLICGFARLLRCLRSLSAGSTSTVDFEVLHTTHICSNFPFSLLLQILATCGVLHLNQCDHRNGSGYAILS
jgi:hypothetical protein